MEKYEQYGLTLTQDGILGSFGATGPYEEEELTPSHFTPAQRDAIKQLFNKGLLDRRILDDDTVTYYLTPAGKRLYKIRADEEDEGPESR